MNNEFYRVTSNTTHRIRVQEKKLKSKMLKTLAIFILLGLFVLFIGLPLFVRLLAGLGDLRTVNVEQKKEESLVFPPSLDSLPQATNSGKIRITGRGEKDTKVKIIVNGRDKGKADTDDEGKFSFPNIILTEGDNSIKATTLKDDKESTTSTEIYISYREEAPEIVIDSPQENEVFYSEKRQVEIKGKTDPDSRLMINGRLVILDSEGNFSHSVKLSEGENTFKFDLKDSAGNSSEKELKVKYIP